MNAASRVKVGFIARGQVAVGAFALEFKKVATFTALSGACAAGARTWDRKRLLESTR